MQQSYSVEDGVSALIKRIGSLRSASERPIIVSIAGGSASGKSSIVAASVAESFKGESITITMDDYFKGKSFVDSETAAGREVNFDHPDYIDLDLLGRHMASLRESAPIDKPVFSFKVQERVGTERVVPPKIVVVEGILALHEQLARVSDVRVFVDASTHGRVARRLVRDLKRTAWSPSFIIGYMGNVLERMYSTYVAPTRQLADMVITNDYDPRRETLRSDSREVQLKFRLDRAFRLPDNIAELASQASQRDEYYTPDSMDLRKSDEIIRIRHEGGRKIFSYKGPRLGSGLIERANVTFPIDDSAEAGILSLYGRRISTVTKERLFYRTHNGVEICIDRNVAKLREGEIVELGDFLNARASPADSGPLRSLVDQLGLERSSMVADSYYNM